VDDAPGGTHRGAFRGAGRFRRVVGEVGAAMMLGGNIRWYTRTITTAIALETSKGDSSWDWRSGSS